jgi:hypothetical protein
MAQGADAPTASPPAARSTSNGSRQAASRTIGAPQDFRFTSRKFTIYAIKSPGGQERKRFPEMLLSARDIAYNRET